MALHERRWPVQLYVHFPIARFTITGQSFLCILCTIGLHSLSLKIRLNESACKICNEEEIWGCIIRLYMKIIMYSPFLPMCFLIVLPSGISLESLKSGSVKVLCFMVPNILDCLCVHEVFRHRGVETGGCSDFVSLWLCKRYVELFRKQVTKLNNIFWPLAFAEVYGLWLQNWRKELPDHRNPLLLMSTFLTSVLY